MGPVLQEFLFIITLDTKTSLHMEGSTFLNESTQLYQAVVGNVLSITVQFPAGNKRELERKVRMG